MLGALQAALDDCDRALGAGMNNAASYNSRGLIYLKMGQLDAAIEGTGFALRLEAEARQLTIWARAGADPQAGRQRWR